MVGPNSLLFLLTTIAPSAYPPESTAYKALVEDGGLELGPCFPDAPIRGPFKCGRNEHYERRGRYCQPTCQNEPCPHNCYMEGCFCDEGYVRGSEGTCIRREECPTEDKTCPQDEDFRFCGTACPKNCTTYDKDIACTKQCVSGCFCKEPRVRGPSGTCILPEDCPIDSLRTPMEAQFPFNKCPVNEEYKVCPSVCPDDCYNFENKWRPCKIMCLSAPGCQCKEGLVRGPDGRCMRPDQCPPRYKGELQSDFLLVPENCLFDHIHNRRICQSFDDWNSTAAQSCLDRQMQLRSSARLLPCGVDLFLGVEFVCCPKIEASTLPSELPFTECPKDQEYKECLSACPDDCDNFENKWRRCKNICLPVPGCQCKEGMVKGPDGRCIRPDQCPGREKASTLPKEFPFTKCPKDEEYKVCRSTCPDDCDNFENKWRPCKMICLPLPGCQCKEGMVKGPDGRCIRPEQCPGREKIPVDCAETEIYDVCGTACEENCTNYNLPDRSCDDRRCVVGCFCKPGFVRGPNGACVWPFECPGVAQEVAATTTEKPGINFPCGPYEEYKECGTACPKNCTDYDKDVSCIESCVEGCFCVEPRVRDSTGRCVLPKDCQGTDDISGLAEFLAICKTNEKLSFCLPLCPDTCKNFENQDRMCKKICLPVPSCICKEGHVDRGDGTCIRTEQCADQRPEDCSAEEYFDLCKSYCEFDCNNYNDPEFKCKDRRCKRGCFCKPGYVRDNRWKCVPADTCHATEAPVNFFGEA